MSRSRRRIISITLIILGGLIGVVFYYVLGLSFIIAVVAGIVGAVIMLCFTYGVKLWSLPETKETAKEKPKGINAINSPKLKKMIEVLEYHIRNSKARWSEIKILMQNGKMNENLDKVNFEATQTKLMGLLNSITVLLRNDAFLNLSSNMQQQIEAIRDNLLLIFQQQELNTLQISILTTFTNPKNTPKPSTVSNIVLAGDGIFSKLNDLLSNINSLSDAF